MIKNESVLLGGLTAETDPLVEECFVRTDLIKSILSFENNRNLVIGKKGSGKSAIFKVGLGRRSKVLCIRISPKIHSLGLQDPNLNYRQYVSPFKYELALECLSALSKDEDFIKKIDKGDLRRIKAVKSEYIKKLKELGKKFGGGSVFGIGLSMLKAKGPLVDLVSYSDYEKVRKLFIEKVRKTKKKCIILIDDPELLFPPAKIYSEAIGALLFSASEITHELKGMVKIVIFLKLHIYQHLLKEFGDIDKLRREFSMLKWEDNDLVNLLSERIKYAIHNGEIDATDDHPWGDLRGENNPNESNKFHRYFMDRLISGPRDLIAFASEIIDWRKQSYRIKDAVNIAEEEYSNDQLNELRREYGNRELKDIDRVVAKLFISESVMNRGEYKATDFLAFLKDRYESIELKAMRGGLDWLEAETPKSLSEILFDIGFLGYWSKNGNRFILPYEIHSERREFLASKKVRINPAFLKGLGIKLITKS